MKPEIDPRDYASLLGDKRFFVASLVPAMRRNNMNKKELVSLIRDTHGHEAISGAVVASAMRQEPVDKHHAEYIIAAVNHHASQNESRTHTLCSERDILGAFFLVKDFDKLIDRHDISKKEIRAKLGPNEGLLDVCLDRFRVILPDALAITRSLNTALRAREVEPLDPRDVILTDDRLQKKRAQAAYFLERSPYEAWPASVLLTEDDARVKA